MLCLILCVLLCYYTSCTSWHMPSSWLIAGVEVLFSDASAGLITVQHSRRVRKHKLINRHCLLRQKEANITYTYTQLYRKKHKNTKLHRSTQMHTAHYKTKNKQHHIKEERIDEAKLSRTAFLINSKQCQAWWNLVCFIWNLVCGIQADR